MWLGKSLGGAGPIVRPRSPVVARRRAPQRRAAAVDVVEWEEDEVSPPDSIDDDDLPFDLDEYKAVKLLVTFQEPDWVNPWSNKTRRGARAAGA